MWLHKAFYKVLKLKYGKNNYPTTNKNAVILIKTNGLKVHQMFGLSMKGLTVDFVGRKHLPCLVSDGTPNCLIVSLYLLLSPQQGISSPPSPSLLIWCR